MLAFLAAAILSRSDMKVELPEPSGSAVLTEVVTVQDALNPPKKSLRPIEDTSSLDFQWLTESLGRTDPTDPFTPRFHVYSQERKETGDTAASTSRMLIRLWQLLNRRWRFDNPAQYHNGSVDVYLCKDGRAGGEQFFGEDYPAKGRPISVNAIYIYDLPSFNRPIEMAREVAHEYGHAVLPPVGGFVLPEDWANGYLGEKLFLRWIRDAMAAKNLEPADTMQADFSALDGWVHARVDPLVLAAASGPPSKSMLRKTGADAMAYYHGLVLYCDSILPRTVTARSMLLIGSTHAWDYPASVVMASQELEKYTLTVPPLLKGKKLWIPLGKGKVTGTQILQRQGDWAEVLPSSTPIVVHPAMPG